MNCKKLINICSLLCIFGVFLCFSLLACAQDSSAQEGGYILKMDLSEKEQALCQEKSKMTFHTAQSLNEFLQKLNTLEAQLDDLRDDFVRKQEQLDLHSENSVNEYNQLNHEISELSRNYQSEAHRYNQAVRQQQADFDWIKNNCLE